MKMNRTIKTLCATMLALAGLTAGVAWAADTISQSIPFTVQGGGSGSGCPGSYTGYAKMTNDVGSIWLTPPTNAISGTLTDVSGFSTPYQSVAYVTQKNNFQHWCDTNSVTFPVTSTTQYQLVVYVKNTPPPPTNGQPINLQITWKTQ
jgi:hypothetical protein